MNGASVCICTREVVEYCASQNVTPEFNTYEPPPRHQSDLSFLDVFQIPNLPQRVFLLKRAQ